MSMGIRWGERPERLEGLELRPWYQLAVHFIVCGRRRCQVRWCKTAFLRLGG